MPNIALLLSGGVDSAVAVHLLSEQGLRPDLYYIKIGMDGDSELTCTAEEDIELATATARRYGLPLQVVDLQKEYWERVVTYTMDHVRRGLTPNPDVMCNRLIKFGAFEQKIGHAYDRIATGHYAQRLDGQDLPAPYREAANVWLGTAPDPVKDQTDFLAQLSREQVEKIMLPIGHLPKSEVRRIALEAKLPPAHRKDSQGICFLGKINYNDFVRRFLGERMGDVVEIETGRKIGQHRGYWFHTIGQRKGLGLGGGPWFVVDKDIEANVLYVSHGYDTFLQYGHEFRLCDFHFLTGNPWRDTPASASLPITFKVRHTDTPRVGMLRWVDTDTCHISAPEPIQGIAPGQFGVVYSPDGKICIGSGEIRIPHI